MKKTTKKAGKKAGKRISISDQTAKKCKTKTGLAREIRTNYDLYATEGSSYRKHKKTEGINKEDRGNLAQTLDIVKARQALSVDQYDDNKKKRQATIGYLKGAVKIQKGNVYRWKGRNRDTKAGNLNTLAKYFFSNVKSSCKMDCNAWNYFTLTSVSDKAEGK